MREIKPLLQKPHLKGAKVNQVGTGWVRNMLSKVEMSSAVESAASANTDARTDGPHRGSVSGSWMGVGAIAAASAVLGGLAAAWFYRKTLRQLQEAQHEIPDSGSAAIEDDSPEDF